ncbi:hypothetical protein [Cyanobium sp. Morenito 9A2]|uniref:hypothetical protein n=1 Tax=Cyanobium sp. Morenito 9A2 TaxID=2823718 RepID=UPI0020CEF320|nr:hypothetical protein [Cyanobium sp. Morenito 9A2]MCP9849841.1 hypothetical protein [Cyanobium sp. Morenito 9A2]
MARPNACALGLLAAALLPWNAPPGAQAAPKTPEPDFPSQETLRTMQLSAINCARENTAITCDPSRKSADGLLDNPWLSASCKDDLWEIRQKSVTASSNSYKRREALNKLAEGLQNVCKPTLKPLVAPAPAAAPKPKSGFNFGTQ